MNFMFPHYDSHHDQLQDQSGDTRIFVVVSSRPTRKLVRDRVVLRLHEMVPKTSRNKIS